MHQSALEHGAFSTTLRLALDATSADRSVEISHRRQLARFGKWLYRLGFVPGTAGNLSVRLSDNMILATPTGMSKFLLRASDMVLVDLDGHKMAERYGRTTSNPLCPPATMHIALARRP